jgi:hypothetical protein
VTHFKVYCAVALAGIGELPDTIMSRSIIIKMQRRAPNESIDPFRTRKHASTGHAYRDRLAEWAESVGETAGEAWPEIPDGIVDRNEEIWEPLLAVADAAGGDWPEMARKACVALCKAAEDRRVSLGIRLLGDLRILFGEYDAKTTGTLLDLLASEHSGLDADAPWAELYGKPINARKLAELLRPYGIKPRKVKIDGVSLQGYRREDLWDSWRRWLPSEEPVEAELPEPKDPTAITNGSGVPDMNPVPEPLDPQTEPFGQGVADL